MVDLVQFYLTDVQHGWWVSFGRDSGVTSGDVLNSSGEIIAGL
jgi:hypothetical protein